MSSSSSAADHNPPTHPNHRPPAFDELRWVIQIRRTFDDDLDDQEAEGVHVSIFNVPKPLLQTKPEAYVPQLIALGPYHHWRPELYEMERYKLSAAKRVQKNLLACAKFEDLVTGIRKHENLMRAYYHRYLEFNGETLSWMMAMDACFLLEFLQIFAAEENRRSLKRIPSRMSHLVDLSGRKSAHNTIIRDIMMLENQIPVFLLRKILDYQRPTAALPADEMLSKMLTGFMKEMTPFRMMESFPAIDDATKHSHLLEILYRILVPKVDHDQEVEYEFEEEGPDEAAKKGGKEGEGDASQVKQLLSVIWSKMSNLNLALVDKAKSAITSKPVTLVLKAPWKMLTNIPGFAVLQKPVETLFSSSKDESEKSTGEANNEKKPPRVEEIMIPCVQELMASGVLFVPTHGDLTTISFDPVTATFSLPVVTLDSNTEIVLRNLVAYEASAASGPLVLARYTELMNGIIDTDEDVRLLRRSGIVLNHMKSDSRAADLWNSMNRSVRLTKVAFVDKAIEGVNRYHSSRWRVKASIFMNKYVYGSWPFLTFVAAVLLLMLTALQSFCSVYTCARWFNDIPVAGQQNQG